uniref:pyrimidine 5'-nucleotidase n=1 Tax=Castellaniella defragrans TaxID=75697 RepID=UPI0033422243
MRPARAPHASRRRAAGRHDDPVWLFDLDNTLHDASRSIFRLIDQHMSAAVATTLGVDSAQADALRRRYWARYGATAIGMARHHGVDINHFLALSHNFEVAPLVHGETGLAQRLRRLPGRKILLTNAPAHYARQVLKTLDILREFDGLWSIEQMNLQGRHRPKPSRALMRQILARLRVPANRVILIEDTLANLKSAHQIGMRTVHVYHPGTPFATPCRGRDLYIGRRVNALSPLLTWARDGRIPGNRGRA